MKNQYFGDIGDYGKYGMLRFFAEHGVSVAINWYLTEDDGSADGKRTKYLEDYKYWKYDPEVYRYLKEYVICQKKREVSLIEGSGLITGAKFYHELLEDPRQFVKGKREEVRLEWHTKALESFSGADIVYLDPDNGFRSVPPRDIKSQTKYCYGSEVAGYYESGLNVVFYTHKGRRTAAQWEEEKRDMQSAVPEAKMLEISFREGSQRSYIFAIHPDEEQHYRSMTDAFLHTDWKDMFG